MASLGGNGVAMGWQWGHSPFFDLCTTHEVSLRAT